MRADELRLAVGRIVDILVRADIRGAVDRFRASRGDERTVAAARLGHAGALVMERFEGLDEAERLVVRSMHLQDLAKPSYWRELIESSSDPKAVTGELVRLTSRVVFATGQLPGMLTLLDAVEGGPAGHRPPTAGESRLVVRLIDAGERASDPDRVARSIDGVDMLYSACASIARKPTMDLRLEAVDGDAVRDIHLTGERDAVAAVAAVLDSIPEVVAELDEDADIDLDELVRSLPVFEDLATLGATGSFSEPDLRDIAETMHQGALLALESGVARVPPSLPSRHDGASAAPATRESGLPAPPRRPAAIVAAPAPSSDESPHRRARTNGADDPYYDDYLRRREAMRQLPETEPEPAPAPAAELEPAARTRPEGMDAMLQALGRARDG